MKEIIYKWIYNLIEGGLIPLELIDETFLLEDGMSLTEYWDYEKNSFDLYSKIFDLDHTFSIKIVHVNKVGNKNICFIYVLNKFNKIAFKMTITVNDENKIASNNFNAQIVPKYVIENNTIIQLGMAIKSKYEIEDIVSTSLEKISFGKGSNFDEDSFYTGKFSIEPSLKQNSISVFYLKFKGIQKLEKRIVFFDQFKIEDCPIMISNNNIYIKDDVYPVNLAIYYLNKKYENFVYPRKIKKEIKNIEKIIVTDVLDNDWIFNLNSD